MKIAIITLNNPFEKISGGIESAVYNLSRALASLGHEVWIVCLGSVEKHIIRREDNVNLWILPCSKRNGIFTKSLAFIKYGRKAIHELENRGVTIFNGQGGLSSPLVFYKPRKAKVIFTIHTLDGENIANIKDCARMKKNMELMLEIIKYLLLKLWRMLYLSRSDYLIFISKFVREEFLKYYWFLRGKKTFLVQNGFPKEYINLETCEKKYDFCYIGRLDKRKCVDLIVNASRILKGGYQFSIIIIGDGPWRRDIEKIIEKNSLKQYISIAGYITYDKISTYILNSKFLILPSSYEIDPLIVKEALALGTPCIVSNIQPLIERIKDGHNGFLFTCYSYLSLSAAMEKALRLDMESYLRISRNAKLLLERITWDDVAKKYIEIFRIIACNDD